MVNFSRASKYPTHLYAFTDDAALAERLRTHYEVPVVWGAEAARLRRLLPSAEETAAAPEKCEECGHAALPAPTRPWGDTYLALAMAGAWPEKVGALYKAYGDDARNRPHGSNAMKWADWSPPARRVEALKREPPSREVARKRVLARQEDYAVVHNGSRCARRALWVRLVRWRRAAIWDAWDTAKHVVRWLGEAQADLARGTTGRGAPPSPTPRRRSRRSRAA